MESIHTYLAPLATIFAAIAGAIVGSVTTYRFGKRKTITFWVIASEDASVPLKQHHRDLVFKVGGREFLNLNQWSVIVENTGNTSITEVRFDIEIPGKHKEYIAELDVDNDELLNSINITSDEPNVTENPRVHLIAPFFNKKERFDVLVYYDGQMDDCKIHCRIEDVKTVFKKGPSLIMGIRREVRENGVKRLARFVAVLLLIAVGALTVVSILVSITRGFFRSYA